MANFSIKNSLGEFLDSWSYLHGYMTLKKFYTIIDFLFIKQMNIDLYYYFSTNCDKQSISGYYGEDLVKLVEGFKGINYWDDDEIIDLLLGFIEIKGIDGEFIRYCSDIGLWEIEEIDNPFNTLQAIIL